jgi:hypothetical protein
MSKVETIAAYLQTRKLVWRDLFLIQLPLSRRRRNGEELFVDVGVFGETCEHFPCWSRQSPDVQRQCCKPNDIHDQEKARNEPNESPNHGRIKYQVRKPAPDGNDEQLSGSVQPGSSSRNSVQSAVPATHCFTPVPVYSARAYAPKHRIAATHAAPNVIAGFSQELK